ncbi:MAG: hypothetical protein JXR22_08240, partial [Prolixibacteraceae bacterium]|nr:hypothetical protein [Prolixibacteraceae bacterium]
MNQKKEHRHFDPIKILKGIFFSLLVLAGSLAIVLLLGSEMLARRYLPEFIARKSENHTHIEFTNLNIDFFKRTISVENVVLESDSLSGVSGNEKAFHFKTPGLKISKIRLWPLLLDRRLMARSLSIESPDLKFGRHQKVDMDLLSANKLNPGDTLVLPFFAELFFDTLSILNARIEIDTLLGERKALQQINLVANHFKLGGIKFTDSPYPFDVSDLLLTLENFDELLPDSIHRLQIGQIRLSLLHHNIRAYRVKLQATSDTLKTSKVLFQLEVPEIELKSDNVDQLHLLDTIHVEQMVFNNPDIAIRFAAGANKGTPLNEINFYELTGQKISWIRINHFRIQNAAIELTPAGATEASQVFSNVNIHFEDFLIDSMAYRDEQRILSASNVSLGVGQYLLYHNDQVHQLQIDSLQIDTRSQKVSTGSVAFVPIDNKQQANITRISFNSSRMNCEQVDFLKMYHHRQLPMQRLFVNEPRIQVDFRQKQNIRKKRNDSSLVLEKISDYLTGVYVDEADINGGRIRLNYLDSNRNEGFFKSDFDIQLINLSVDSSTFEQSDKLFFAEDFNVGFNDLTLQLADETHQLSTASILLSSSGKKAEIKELIIQPREQKIETDSLLFQNRTELFHIRFPHISFNGANLHRAFFDKKLYINNMAIRNPSLSIEKYGEWNTDNLARTPYQQSLYALIDDYLFSINIRKVSMENGLLNIKQHKASEPTFELSNQFSITMEQFELDEAASERPHKLFFSDEIDLVLKNHDFTLADGVHKITTREIGILSSEKRIYISQAKLYPDILSEKFSSMPLTVFADIPEIQFTNTDIFGFFNKGNFPVDQVIISRPVMKVLLQKTDGKKDEATNDQKLSLFSEFKAFTARRISIENGKLELARYENFKSQAILNTSIDFSLDHFQALQTNNRFETSYDDFRFNLANLLLNTGDESHRLQLQAADYRLSTGVLALKNLQLNPVKKAHNTERVLEIDLLIPEIKLTGFDARQFQKKQNIELKQVQVNEPILTLTDRRIEAKKSFSPYNLNLYKYIQPLMKSLSADEVQLNKTVINLNQKQNRQFRNIDILAHKVLIDEEHSRKGKLLNAEAVEANVQQIKGTSRGDFFEYRINELKLNDKGDFSISGLHLSPLMSEQEFARRKVYQADYFDIKNMNASGNGLDVKEFIENQNFYVNELSVDFDEVKIYRDKNFPFTPNLKTKLPQQALRDLKTGLEIKKAMMKVAYFQFSELEPEADQKSMVFVTGATFELQNVTNRKSTLEKQPNMMGT